MPSTILTSTQRYAAGALFGLALHQAQIHQTHPLGSPPEDVPTADRTSSGSSSDSVSEDPELWVNESSGLLRPVFRFLEIDSNAWSGLEETAGSSSANHHVGAFLRLLSEENEDTSSDAAEKELALAKGVDAMVSSMEISFVDQESKKEKLREYEFECREKFSTGEIRPESDVANKGEDLNLEDQQKHPKIEPESLEKIFSGEVQSKSEVANLQHDNLPKHSKYDCEFQQKISTGEMQSKSEVANLQHDNLPNYSKHDCESERKISTGEIQLKSEVANLEHDNPLKHSEYDCESQNKISAGEIRSRSEVANVHLENQQKKSCCLPSIEQMPTRPDRKFDEKPFEELVMLGYPRKVTVLYELLSACLANTPENKKSAHQRKGYDARHRVALRLLVTWFDIKPITMEAVETMVACSAMAILKEEESKEDTQSPKSKWAKWKRGGIIGAAALTGGTLMAITGGLAAPAIAAGFSALAPTLGTLIPVIGASGFAAVATAAGSVAGSVAVAASFGAAGAGLTGSKMARRIGDIDEFEFKAIGENHNQGRLAVEILVSGFVFEEEDYRRPWEGQHDNLERYALQWESKHLIAVSTAIQDFITSRLALELMKQGAMMTVLHTLLIALAWPATLLAVTDFIDSKWAIAVDRSDKAGKLLADVLMKGLQGHRPVTLVGFSLGARVVFKCLQYLTETERNEGLIERVVLLGAPVAIKDENWEAIRKVVAGRFVNAYSTNDWMLGVAFRASLLTRGLAGIQPIDVPGIENVDVTEVIEGHSSYLWATQEIIERLDLDTYYPVFSGTAMKPWNIWLSSVVESKV